MAMFNSNTIPVTEKAMTATSTQAAAISGRAQTAVSTFRATVDQLRAVNADLDTEIATANQMIAFYTEQLNSANKQKADNEAICAKILDIIGA